MKSCVVLRVICNFTTYDRGESAPRQPEILLLQTTWTLSCSCSQPHKQKVGRGTRRILQNSGNISQRQQLCSGRGSLKILKGAHYRSGGLVKSSCRGTRRPVQLERSTKYTSFISFLRSYFRAEMNPLECMVSLLRAACIFLVPQPLFHTSASTELCLYPDSKYYSWVYLITAFTTSRIALNPGVYSTSYFCGSKPTEGGYFLTRIEDGTRAY